VLTIDRLTVAFRTEDGLLRAVDGVSLAVGPGETVGIVGESGCGKSTVALAVMRLLPPSATCGGAIGFDGTALLAADEARMRTLRGGAIAMIFQDATASLHPMLRVGAQIAEALRAHERISRREARRRAIALLAAVGIPSPEIRVDAYPHELSGGMCQRVAIAAAIACGPRVIIADEPTTALDVTVQAQILELIAEIRRRSGTAVLLITHDLGVVAGMTDRVAVMYAGRIVETAPTDALFARPSHPYTQGLLRSVPPLGEGIGRDLPAIPGSVDAGLDLPGCRFAPRCAFAREICRTTAPTLEPVAEAHLAACWFRDRAAA
jgi:oligopeptide/dipeptide ABC transporter ATP-binding protein